MKTEPNERVFPPMKFGNDCTVNGGMTIREHFAGLAMQGLLASDDQNKPATAKTIANWSVECADALIQALNQPKP